MNPAIADGCALRIARLPSIGAFLAANPMHGITTLEEFYDSLEEEWNVSLVPPGKGWTVTLAPELFIDPPGTYLILDMLDGWDGGAILYAMDRIGIEEFMERWS